MIPGKCRYYAAVCFVIAVSSAISVEAQKFRGFYSSRELRNNESSSRYYRPGRSSNQNYGYVRSNNNALNYRSNSAYPDDYLYQASDENSYVHPAANLTINIFAPDYTHLPATQEHFNRNASSYTDNNRNYYPPDNNRITVGSKTIKINGNRYYEMNGNYYRVNPFENQNPLNYQTNQPIGEYNKVRDQQIGNGFYTPAINERGNSNYLVDGYDGMYNTNTGKRSVDNDIVTLQKQQRTLQQENDALKQKLNEQQATLVEQQRRQQMIKEDIAAKEQQQVQKNDIKQNEARKKDATEANPLYSNLNIGDTVDQIPQNSKIITIDGKKTFISPRNIYYQQQKNSKFTVVGMEKK
jgi:hypothetical protein